MLKIKEKIITRTIKSTRVNFMFIDLTPHANLNVQSDSVYVSGDVKNADENDLLEYVRSVVETKTLRVIKAVAIAVEEEKYFQTESDFIKNGKKIDKNAPIAEEEAAEEEDA